ncbi:ubiquitin-like protein [Endozoicomonas sp. ONNA1]|uniref:ubiquitin-like protein n=1 Tax=Endozoicomonas sp. ONNA1 TaxID=2828740 RepID=UPI002147CDBB|nr:ubiquitin-like protein [Endozoicomonas sp. ONNA1]
MNFFYETQTNNNGGKIIKNFTWSIIEWGVILWGVYIFPSLANAEKVTTLEWLPPLLENQEYQVKSSLKVKSIQPGTSPSDQISITLFAEPYQHIVACSEEISIDGEAPVDMMRLGHFPPINTFSLVIKNPQSYLTLKNPCLCPPATLEQYPYKIGQYLFSDQPIMAVSQKKKKSKNHLSSSSSDLIGGVLEPKSDLNYSPDSDGGFWFDDDYRKKRPGWIPQQVSTDWSMDILPVMRLDWDWNRILPSERVKSWLFGSRDDESGVRLLININGQPTDDLFLSPLQYQQLLKHMSSTRELMLWLKPRLTGLEAFIDALLEIVQSGEYSLALQGALEEQLASILEQPHQDLDLNFEIDALQNALNNLLPEAAIHQLGGSQSTQSKQPPSGEASANSQSTNSQPSASKVPKSGSIQKQGAGAPQGEDGKDPLEADASFSEPHHHYLLKVGRRHFYLDKLDVLRKKEKKAYKTWVETVDGVAVLLTDIDRTGDTDIPPVSEIIENPTVVDYLNRYGSVLSFKDYDQLSSGGSSFLSVMLQEKWQYLTLPIVAMLRKRKKLAEHMVKYGDYEDPFETCYKNRELDQIMEYMANYIGNYDFSDEVSERLRDLNATDKIYIFCRFINGNIITLYVSPHVRLEYLKELIHDKEGTPPDQMRLVFGGNELEGETNKTLSDYKILNESTIHLVLRFSGSGTIIMHHGEAEINSLLTRYERGEPIKQIPLRFLHVSCHSYKPKSLYGNERLAGIMLYSADGKLDWVKNGVHCKAGYIIIQRTQAIKGIKSSFPSQIHGKLYKSVFGEYPDSSVIGCGFSYNPDSQEWVFNSISLNIVDDDYHDGSKILTEIEKDLLIDAVKNWFYTGEQNFNTIEDGEGFVLPEGERFFSKHATWIPHR